MPRLLLPLVLLIYWRLGHKSQNRMLLAASYAGIGFGNAGVHLPHAMAYPVAGQVEKYQPAGYPADHPMVPHGTSVIVHTPAVCRVTAA